MTKMNKFEDDRVWEIISQISELADELSEYVQECRFDTTSWTCTLKFDMPASQYPHDELAVGD